MPVVPGLLALLVLATLVLGAASIGAARSSGPAPTSMIGDAQATLGQGVKKAGAVPARPAVQAAEVVRDKRNRNQGPVLGLLWLLMGSSHKR